MAAPLPLIRKFYALTSRVTEALNERAGDGEPRYEYDPIDVLPFFEKWIRIRAELIASEPELDDIAPCTLPTPIVHERYGFVAFEGRGFIHRESIVRIHKEFRNVWDILHHPSREGSQITIDREGIFVGGKPFDAMLAVTSIIRAATKSITIVDGYVSDHTISLLGVKADPVASRILTGSANGALVTAAKLFNTQYAAGPPVELRTTKAFHDRFIVVDDAEYYHFGHSLKDAAKKQAFMFSRIEEPTIIKAAADLIAKEWTAATVVPL